MTFEREIVLVLASYALGGLSTGYYLVRVRTGQDIRSLGSGSAGGSNVARALGSRGFFITVLGDVSKGAVAAGSALYLGLEPWGVTLVMIAVVAGSIWPAQLGFRGGKGLATAGGAMLVFDFWLVMAVAGVAAVVLVLSRQRAGGLVAVAITPAIAAAMGFPLGDVLGVAVLVLLVLFAHRSNIQGTIRGAGRPLGEGQ